LALKNLGELSFIWPELTLGWAGSYFGLLNLGINIGWARETYDELFKRYDEVVFALRPFDPSILF
jgi:hypothetical protein